MVTNIYTPTVIGQKMSEELISTWKSHQTVLDNSCGDGALVVEIMKRIPVDALDSFIRNLHINDIDEVALNRALENINQIYFARTGKINIVKVKHSCKNILTEDLDSKKVDYVIMNPPYGKLSDLDKVEVQKIKKRWKKYLFGQNDLYLLFLHAAIQQTKVLGSIVFVCPNRWVNSLNGTKLRERLTQDGSSYGITLWKSEEFNFKGVDTYPLVGKITKLTKNAEIKVFLEDKEVFRVKTKKMGKGPWELYGQTKVADKSRFITVGALGVSGGITTLTNSVFFLYDTKIEGDDLILSDGTKIELAATRVAYKQGQPLRVITPYRYCPIEQRFFRVGEMELRKLYPKTYAYLAKESNYKKIVTTAKGDKSTHEWWQWGRSQNLNKRFPKILIPPITKKVKAILVDEDTFPADMLAIDTSCLTKSATNTLMLILESPVFWEHVQNFERTYKGGCFGISSKCLKSFMIPNLIVGEFDQFDKLQPCDQKRVLERAYK